MDYSAVTWQEIESWQKTHGLELTPFELDVIKRSSHEYVQWSKLAQETDCKCPVNGAIEVNQLALARRLKNILR